MAWKIQAILLSPMCLNQRRGVGNVLPTLDFIPGSTVRGALAARWLQIHDNKTDDEFKQLFLNEGVSFPNLYIDGGAPVPLTARTCKYFEGFVRGVRHHGVADAVIPWLRYEKLKLDQDLDNIMDACQAPSCGAPLEPWRGYYAVQRGSYHTFSTGKRLLARTAIQASRGVAKSGDLYTLEVLNEGQKFSGFLRDSDAEIERIQKLVHDDKKFFLGYSRNRGLGEVEIMIFKTNPRPGLSLEQRLRAFNQKLHKEDNKVTHFTVTLQSDVILLNELLGYRSRPEVEDLVRAAGDGDAKGILESCGFATAWTETGRASGWQAAWGLPKSEEQVLLAGSVFVYGWANSLQDNQITPLAQALQRLEDNGLGERPAEGFGRVRVCDAFHWDRWERK